MTTYNLLELITVYVKKLLEKDKKKKTQLDSPFYNNNNTKKMSSCFCRLIVSRCSFEAQQWHHHLSRARQELLIEQIW